ncbi:MAG: hypothetical protein WCJ35_26845 [Planctomycetota bacterium]
MIWRKHYRSMYEGSMIGAGAAVFALMGYVISHQEYERGLGCWVVRLNPVLLSAVMGEKVDVIQGAIDYLCAPDKNSGSPLEEGRRLVGLGERSMEYRVVNGEKYQEMRDYEERKVQNREAQAKWREKRKAEAGAAELGLESNGGGGQGNVSWHPDPVQLRLSALFHRRPDTAWSKKECAAFKALGEIPESDLALIETYYRTEPLPGAGDFRRRDLCTLLNNFPGEVDRARKSKPSKCF